MVTGVSEENARVIRIRAGVGIATVLLLGFAPTSFAQTWRITPSIALRETLTDNVNQAPAATAQSDLVTEIIPGINITGDSPRLKLFLNYSLDFVLYAKTASANNNTQSSLGATANYEAIDGFFFIDAQATISQQAILPFGPAPTISALSTQNRTQTQTYQVSPYIRGPIAGDTARYELRYTVLWNNSQDDTFGSSTLKTINGFVRGSTGVQSLGWGLVGSQQSNDYVDARDTSSARAAVDLNYTFNPEFRINADVGRERNNYTTLEQTTYDNYGGGFDWHPGERTRVFAFVEHRFFGTGWSAGWTQRSPFLTFNVSSTQDVTTNGQQQLAGANGGSAFDLLFASLTTRIPDPVQRAIEAQRLLAQAGLPNDLFLPNGFAYGQQVVQQSNTASILFNGVRNTLAFSINQTKQTPLTLGVQDPSNFNSPTSTIQTGTSSAWTYAISAITSFALTGNYLHSKNGDNTLSSDQWTANATVTTQFGPRTSASFGARYNRFESDQVGSSDYQEKAIFAYLSYRF
jgi:uncharacterized protein (PEP-CTERM system associated)